MKCVAADAERGGIFDVCLADRWRSTRNYNNRLVNSFRASCSGDGACEACCGLLELRLLDTDVSGDFSNHWNDSMGKFLAPELPVLIGRLVYLNFQLNFLPLSRMDASGVSCF